MKLKLIMQHVRPLDQRGLNVFEAPKEPGGKFKGTMLEGVVAF